MTQEELRNELIERTKREKQVYDYDMQDVYRQYKDFEILERKQI